MTWGMDPSLRPDLRRILPRPWLQQLGDHGPPLDRSLRAPADRNHPDFVVDVDRVDAPAGDEAGFELHQVHAVTDRLRATFARPDAGATAHRPDAERVRTLLFPD